MFAVIGLPYGYGDLLMICFRGTYSSLDFVFCCFFRLDLFCTFILTEASSFV